MWPAAVVAQTRARKWRSAEALSTLPLSPLPLSPLPLSPARGMETVSMRVEAGNTVGAATVLSQLAPISCSS